MEISLPLEKMTIEEKLHTMETIWEDLYRNSDKLESPKWHKKILDDREKRVAEGREKIYDWDEAKKNIRDRLNQYFNRNM